MLGTVQFSSVQSLSCVWLSVTPWIAARQASLSITNSQSPPKPMSIESVIPSDHLILCRPILLLPSTFPSIRGFSNESTLHIRWPEYWSFSFNTSPSNEHLGWYPLGWTGWISLQSKGLSRVSPTPQCILLAKVVELFLFFTFFQTFYDDASQHCCNF